MVPPQEIEVSRRTTDGAAIVKVIGEVTLTTSSDVLREVMAGVEEADERVCIVDLTDVTFLGSPGIAMLVIASSQASSLGGALRIVVDSGHPVVRPIQVTGLIDVLTLYNSVDEALAATPAS